MKQRDRKQRINVWVAIGALILIVLLIVWLSFAMMTGDTDVAAEVYGLVTNPSFNYQII